MFAAPTALAATCHDNLSRRSRKAKTEEINQEHKGKERNKQFGVRVLRRITAFTCRAPSRLVRGGFAVKPFTVQLANN